MDVQRDNLQMCRTCLFDPTDESDIKHIKLMPVFSRDDVADTLNEKISQVFDIKIEKNDIKPKLICEKCHAFTLKLYEKRKIAAESQIILNFITAKRNRHNQGKRKIHSSSTEISNEKTKKATPDNTKTVTSDNAKKTAPEMVKKTTPEMAKKTIPEMAKKTTPEMVKETNWAKPKELKQSTSEKTKCVTKKMDSEIQRRFKSITNYIEKQCLKE